MNVATGAIGVWGKDFEDCADVKHDEVSKDNAHPAVVVVRSVGADSVVSPENGDGVYRVYCKGGLDGAHRMDSIDTVNY